MKISILNITARHGGIDILWADLKRQTFTDWELVMVDALYKERENEVKSYINDPRLVYVPEGPMCPGAYTNLAHADNDGFGACSGELIVCLQDYIWIPPDALAKFWYHHQTHPEGILVTGVGDQYNKPSVGDIVDEHGPITVFGKPYTRRPEGKFWSDPRKRTDTKTFYKCNAPDWEMNFSSIPRKVIHELGGMDEDYDFHGFAYDNVNISIRAQMLGYDAYIDQTNECMGFDHDGWWPNPLKEKRINPGEYHVKVLNEMVAGIRPIKLPFLS